MPADSLDVDNFFQSRPGQDNMNMRSGAMRDDGRILNPGLYEAMTQDNVQYVPLFFQCHPESILLPSEHYLNQPMMMNNWYNGDASVLNIE